MIVTQPQPANSRRKRYRRYLRNRFDGLRDLRVEMLDNWTTPNYIFNTYTFFLTYSVNVSSLSISKFHQSKSL